MRSVWTAALTAALLASVVVAPGTAFGQGSASSGAVAQPKRPLPDGIVAPRIEYRDLAEESGLRGVAVSGSPTHKNFIVESTGTGAAIFDYDRDGLADVL